MADPLSILGGIALLIQTGDKVIGYIKKVKESPNDRMRLLVEVKSTIMLCGTLQDFVEMNGEKEWASTFKLLNNENGPIAQLQENLNLLERRLASASNKDNYLKALKWPFDKKEIQEILVNIERQKSLFQIAQENDHLQLSLALNSATQNILKDVNALLTHQENQKKSSFFSQLTSIDFEATLKDIYSRCVKGTGGWLFKTPEYTSWIDKPGTLWCRGIPGAGKTILSSLVIHTLHNEKRPDVGVAGLFCSYRNPETLLNMLGSLIKQLAVPLDRLPSAIYNRAPSSLDDFRSILLDLICLHSRLMIVIDALDECVHRIELLKELNRLTQDNQSKDSINFVL